MAPGIELAHQIVPRVVEVPFGIADVVGGAGTSVEAVIGVTGNKYLGRAAEIGFFGLGNAQDIAVVVIGASHRIGLGIGDHREAAKGIVAVAGGVAIVICRTEAFAIGRVGPGTGGFA